MSLASAPGPALQALAAMSSSEWNTYMQYFVPQENLALQYAMNPNQAQTNMTQAQGLQEQANTQAAGTGQRQLAQFDTQLTPAQQAEQTKQTGINNALSNVTAANAAKDITVQQQMGIMGTQATGITGNL
jgi:hypothetical protein